MEGLSEHIWNVPQEDLLILDVYCIGNLTQYKLNALIIQSISQDILINSY